MFNPKLFSTNVYSTKCALLNMSKNSQKQAFENIKPMKSSEFRKLYYAILRSLDRIERKTIQIAALCKWYEEQNKKLDNSK